MIYFDMDGVLFLYEREAYIHDDKGLARYNTLGGHYFSTVQVDTYAAQLFKRCLSLLGGDVGVLTSVSKDPELRIEQVIDKIMSVYKLEKSFDIGSKFIAVSSDKRDYITKIRETTLTSRDVLIDDWNANLYQWAAAGGTAIKYINGINSIGSWVGKYISKWDSMDKALNLILSTIVG